MTTMVHEFELSHDSKCVEERDRYWNVELDYRGNTANVQFRDINEMLECAAKWKEQGTVTMRVTEVKVHVEQIGVKELFGFEF